MIYVAAALAQRIARFRNDDGARPTYDADSSMMKRTLPALLVSLALTASGLFAAAGSVDASKPSPPSVDLKELVTRVQAQLEQGKRTEAELADDIKGFDALLEKYHDQKSDDVAQILFMKAMLYFEVMEDEARSSEMLTKLVADFPETETAKRVPEILDGIKERASARKLQAELVGKPAPALDFAWSSRTGLASLADVRGKLVVLDFWATWCGPCVASFPNIREIVERYAGYDVEIIGVTSLQGYIMGLSPPRIDCEKDPEKEMRLMKDFMKAKSVTWTVAFSKQEVFNPEYGIQGIPFMAIIAPDGTVRHVGLHPAMPLEEKTTKIDAILKEFGLKTPSA